MDCAICGAPHHPGLGIWIAATDDLFTENIALDEMGQDHYAMMHPMVVSLRQAALINSQFRGKGYTLEPVFKRHAETSLLAEAVVGAAKDLQRGPPQGK